MTNRSEENRGFTLSDATDFSRKAIVAIVIGIITYTVLRMLFIAAVNYYKAMNPPPPPPPTVGFGRLPPIEFPSQEQDVWPKKFVLETARNKLPEFPDRVKVFAMEVPTSSLLADQKVREIAGKYGFVDQPEMLDANNYRWIKYSPLEAIFEINLVNQNISLLTDYQTRPELISNKNLPDRFDAVSAVKSYLGRGDLLPRDVATASGDISYARVLAGELLPAVSLSDANFIRVDLNRVPIDEQLSSFTPEGKRGIISAVISGALSGDDQVVELSYNYQNVLYDEIHTYPLKPINKAWQELQQGQGYIASGAKLEQAVVRDVVLGYFEGYKDQSYLQPIYVFSGDEDFIAYVHAVDSRFVVIE